MFDQITKTVRLNKFKGLIIFSYLTHTASRIFGIFRIKTNILLFLQAVNNEIFYKLIILGKYRKPHGGVKTLEGLKTVNKYYLSLMCFFYTHHTRNNCYNKLKNNTFVKNLNDGSYEKQQSIHFGKVPVWINYEYTRKSYYTLSPRGAG